jgi:hypothetical protein
MLASQNTKFLLQNLSSGNTPYAVWASNASQEAALAWQNEAFSQLELEESSFPFLAELVMQSQQQPFSMSTCIGEKILKFSARPLAGEESNELFLVRS